MNCRILAEKQGVVQQDNYNNLKCMVQYVYKKSKYIKLMLLKSNKNNKNRYKNM